MQGTTRQHPPLEYDGEQTTFQRLHTALGRGIEAGQQENREAEEQTKAQATAGDQKIDAARKKLEQMTPATIRDGIQAAEQEAKAELQHAGADPKGTFNRALARIRQGVEDTAQVVKDDALVVAQQTKDRVVSAAQEVAVWAKEPAVEEAEDLLKLGGRKAATAHRDVTKNVAAGVVLGGALKVAGGVVIETLPEGQAAKQLLGAAEKDAAKGAAHGKLAKKTGEEVIEHTDEAAARRLLKKEAAESAETEANRAKKLKAKDRRTQERAQSLEEKNKNPNFEETASEQWSTWQHQKVEKELGKDARRRLHDSKAPGQGDRSEREILEDISDLRRRSR